MQREASRDMAGKEQAWHVFVEALNCISESGKVSKAHMCLHDHIRSTKGGEKHAMYTDYWVPSRAEMNSLKLVTFEYYFTCLSKASLP